MTHALVQSKKKLVDTTLNFIVTQRVNFYLSCFPRIGKYKKFKYLIYFIPPFASVFTSIAILVLKTTHFLIHLL